MAEQERLTKKQRREQAREERRAREAAEAERRKKGNLRNGLITFVVVAMVGAVLFQAFTGGPDAIDSQIQLVSAEVEDARQTAGCEIITDQQPLEDRTHYDSSAGVDTDRVYTDGRPTHSGPHTVGMHPVTPSASNQIDEVSSTHNLEHGSVIVWYDDSQVDADTISSVGSWAEQLNDNGFARPQAGVGILSSPYEDPGIDSGKAIAFRAWGTAMDCDSFDEDVANAFVLDHFGTKGIAPERTLGGFPDELLGYADQDNPDTSTEEAPLDEGFEDDPDAAEQAEHDAEVDPDTNDEG